MDGWMSLFLFVIAVIYHELFHFIGFLLCNKYPVIKFKWWGVTFGEEACLNVTRGELIFIALYGIMGGLIPILIIESLGTSTSPLIWIYFIACCMDVTLLSQLFTFNRYDLNQPIKEFYEEQYQVMKSYTQ